MDLDSFSTHGSHQIDGLAQALIDDGVFPVLVVDANETIVFANTVVCDTLGYAAKSLRRMTLRSVLDLGSWNKAATLVATARQGRTPAYELNFVSRDGRVVLFALYGTPLADTAVALVGQILASAIATTERLIDTNRHLSALFAIASELAHAVMFPDLLSKALQVVRTELELRAGAIWLDLADDRAELPSQSAMRLAAQQGFVEATIVDGARVLEQIGFGRDPQQSEWIRTGSPEEIGLDPRSLLGVIGPLIHVAVLPLRSESRLIGWLLIVSDSYRSFVADELRTLHTIGQLLAPPIEHARLFATLVERSSQLQAVLDGIDSGVVLVDNAGIVLYANARLEALLGVDVKNWAGMRRADLPLHHLSLHQPNALFGGELLVAQGTPRRLLRRLIDDVADTNGQPLGMIEIFNDVTAAEEMNQLKDDFIAAAAHDLKTPVTAIKGYAQLALRVAQRMEAPRLVSQLEHVADSSDDLTALIDTLLDVSRIQSGRLALDVSMFPLDALVQQVARRFAKNAQRQQRDLHIDLPAPSTFVHWDRIRIGRVLTNLVENAFKYSPEGGQVVLAVEVVPSDGIGQQWVELSVTDHGIGILAAERGRVFERFYRAPGAVRDGFSGTGLGLYICQQLVSAHGGTIAVADARHGGRGTTFTVRLPMQVIP